MSDKTGIQWTDTTWNCVVGCTKVSQGCRFCYAKTLHDLRHKAALAGKKMPAQYAEPFETVQLVPERLLAPLGWRKPRRVFVNSVSDLFHPKVPDEFLDRVFAIMALTPWHTYQILTKRPTRMRAYMAERWQPDANQSIGDDRHARVLRAVEAFVYSPPTLARFSGDRWWTATGGCIAHAQPWPLPNVWLGTSVENQDAANERILPLLKTPAAVRFLSCEPLLGPLDLECWLDEEGYDYDERVPPLDWVIAGGESGAKARPCDIDWITAIVDQCLAAGVACFVKQLGAKPVCANDSHGDDWPGGCLPIADSYEPHHQGEIAPLHLTDRKGGDPSEWPDDLRVREFPRVEVTA